MRPELFLAGLLIDVCGDLTDNAFADHVIGNASQAHAMLLVGLFTGRFRPKERPTKYWILYRILDGKASSVRSGFTVKPATQL